MDAAWPLLTWQKSIRVSYGHSGVLLFWVPAGCAIEAGSRQPAGMGEANEGP